MQTKRLYAVIGQNLEKEEKEPMRTCKAICEAINKYNGTCDSQDDILMYCNNLMHGYGVEALRGQWRGGYWGDTEALYVNMGDTYTGTILYDVRTDKFVATSWGDFVELHPKRFI